LIESINIGPTADEMTRLHTDGNAFRGFAPSLAWTRSNDPEHVVQFYESDNFLLNSLSGFIATGLADGESCVVVATKSHRDGLEERLHLYGIDVVAVKSSGQYVSLDAADILSQFIVNGAPDPNRFGEVIGGVVTRAVMRGQRVRVFGEMVALLWDEGNTQAALQLEGLWNDLSKSNPFTLYCAYPINGFDGHGLAEGLHQVCGIHARVIPAESYTSLTNSEDRLRNIIKLQQKARLLEAEVADRKQAEEQLRVSLEQERIARAEAENANRLKDEFLATVSHELRTPLNAIIGWLYMIRRKSPDEATLARAIETIERNAKSQAQLIEDILDVSRVITGKLRLDNEQVDIVTVINDAIDSMQLAADTKGIHLEVIVEPSSRHVFGDSARLQQIVWNLISNAIKFTPSGGRVVVRLDRAGPNAQITVSDTGEGIEAEFFPFIFDRFRQADGASTRRHGGLGLGLAIVRHLVELHGGTVHVDSLGKGCGSTFTIRLPLAVQDEPKKIRSRVTGGLQSRFEGLAQDKSNYKLQGVRVLIVDNDQDTLNVLAAMLTECGAIVQTSSSVAEALDNLHWFKADVVVSDLAMPDEDGYALIGKIRTLAAAGGKQIPAVALTAYVRVDDRARALAAGFNMFVPKPVVPSELIAAIVTLSEFDSDHLLMSNKRTR
jgi:signal transduction histidine kinase/ActR/RegA family two-component response regulator